MIITIDGPAASGKSTIAQLLAQKWGLYYIYSGLLYRAYATLLITECHYTVAQLPQLTQEQLDCVDTAQVCYRYNAQRGAHIYYKNRDITPHLATPQVGSWASILGLNSHIRECVNAYQRTLAACHDSIADGRDCGTVVFPDATYKFFLTAALDVRAARVYKQNSGAATQNQIKHAIEERDARDTTRQQDPLIPAADAYSIDTSNMSIEQVLSQIATKIGRSL